MKVYGFDEHKVMAAVDLPIEEIVATRIHPTRVDLFDPQPIQREVLGTTLSFTRLRKFSFGFKDKRMGHVGAYDGEQGQCYSGRFHAPEDRPDIVLTRVKASRGGFDQILINYLKARESYLIARSEMGRFAPESCNPLPFEDAEADNLFLDRGSLIYREEQSSSYRREQMLFAGEMFARTPVVAQLPDSVKLILDVLRQWHPVIVGSALRNILTGRKPGALHILVSPSLRADELRRLGADSIRRRSIPGRGETAFSFRMNGNACKVFCCGQQEPAGHERYCKDIAFSHNQLFCDNPTAITATRIALFDISRRQFRLISGERPPWYLKEYAAWCTLVYTASKNGFKFVQTPFFELETTAPKPPRQHRKKN